MRTIHYSIRSTLVLFAVSLFYVSISVLFQQAIRLPFLILLLVITLGSERLWALLAWMSPVVGKVDRKEQERTQKRMLEHELSRSLRYGSPLVLAAIREKKRTSLHLIKQRLRSTDVVLRSSAGYLLTLMPNTSIDQARHAFQRLASQLPLQDVVVMDEHMLQGMLKANTRGMTPQELAQMYTHALDAKLANIAPTCEDNDAPIIHNLIDHEQAQLQVA